MIEMEIDLNELIQMGLGLINNKARVYRNRSKKNKAKKENTLKLMELEHLQHIRYEQLAFRKWCKPADWYPNPVFQDAAYDEL